MTSRKRDYSEFSDHADGGGGSGATGSSHDDEKFVYNPSNPLYAFRFVDDLIEQHRSTVKPSEINPDIVCCPRAYEESFLREPLNDERSCANNVGCQGMHVPCSSPFVLREFFLPGESPSDSKNGLCLMCTRYEIARQFFRHAAGEGTATTAHVSKFYNSTSVPGEYDIKDCIVNPGKHFGLTMPVVLHVRSAYDLQITDGVKRYTQAHYSDNTADSVSEGPTFLCRGAVLQSREPTARSNTLHPGA